MKLTPWFDGCQKPVRAGLYRRMYPPLQAMRWAVWDGSVWSYGHASKRLAIEMRGLRSPLQCLPWRGIAGPEL